MKTTKIMATTASDATDTVISVQSGFQANNLSSLDAKPKEWADFMETMQSCHEAMARSTGTIYIVDEPNLNLTLTGFDRPLALLAGYLIREMRISSTQAIRACGALMWHKGVYFDKLGYFTRSLHLN